MTQLTIFKASAGSGKTFRLVLEYLKLLVENPFNYRHILAVTFTNKATAEMKARILRDLDKVAKSTDKGIVELLIAETGLSEMKITENAQLALSNILHDYDRFAISTIDSFFQRVLRSFARETGLYGAYEVDLDQEAVLNEACDRLLLSVETDLPLRNWLLSMSEHQLGQGKNWEFRRNILELGQELLKEPFQKYMVLQSSPEAERQKLNKLKEQLIKSKTWFENQLQEFGKKGLTIVTAHQLQLTDFSGGSRTFMNYFQYWADRRMDKIQPTKTFIEAVNNPEKFHTKTSKLSSQIIDCYHDGLNQLMVDVLQFLEKDSKGYQTAVEIQKYIYSLGVLTVLSAKVREVGHEKNSLLLSEGNTLLNGIIGNNDTPFIYEKTGNYYHFFMIDEFQDTSVTQWENFKPLIQNSLAENHPNLVVGDVKQSIYRWRNSDWQLLDKTIKEELKQFRVIESTLDSNWRSCENVVNFNNSLFGFSKIALQQHFNNNIENQTGELFDQYRQTIVNAYADVEQTAASGKKGGLVHCSFIGKEGYVQQTLDQLIAAIERVQDLGFQAGDIAILVKKNKEGKDIAEALLNHKKNKKGYNFEVISDDTLYIQTSPTVRFIVGLMQYLITPFDKVAQASVIHIFAENILPLLEAEKSLPTRMVSEGQQQISFETSEQKQHHFISDRVRNDYFPFMTTHGNKELVQHWANRSVADLTEELVQRYNLDQLTGEQANLQAFKDVVADFSKRESGSLHKFIEWWEQFGNKVKLQTAGQRDAIRIMTIHKSKGLEFPVVMLPFCDWDFKPNSKNASILWCPTNNTPFEQFPVLPVRYNSMLSNSFFSESYYTEMLLAVIDNLNMLYVALTRAEKGLFIFTDQKKETDSITVSSLLMKAITDSKTPEPLLHKTEENSYETGTLVPTDKKEGPKSEVNLSGKIVRQSKLAESLRLRENYDDFLEHYADIKQLHINEGKLMHDLLSEINTTGDLDNAIQQMVGKGRVESSRVNELKTGIGVLLANPLASTWFDGTYKVLNEKTILSPNFDLLRPDRVMVNGIKAIVVDYKLTSTTSAGHKKQVEMYVQKVRDMGYTQVEGYVWYLKTNTILNVDGKFQ